MDATAAEGDEVPAVITAGLGAVRAELEQRVNAYREQHAEPLSRHFHGSIGYQIEKASTAARACLAGERQDAIGWDRAMGTEALRETFERFLGELRQRGYREDICSDAVDALYILERSTALLDGQRGIDARDVDLEGSKNAKRRRFADVSGRDGEFRIRGWLAGRER